MDDRERLEAIVEVVRRYLPIDGISIEEAMGEIIELADPLPGTLLPKREWVGLTDDDLASCLPGAVRTPPGWRQTAQAIEAKLKEKNT